jgi:addiction module RelE/StbE family toxin
MARQIVWTAPAEKDRKEILAYWKKRNGTANYSVKLLDRFNAALAKILDHPFIGRPADISGVRVLPVAEYLIFYEVVADAIVVQHIWDARRDMRKLKF